MLMAARKLQGIGLVLLVLFLAMTLYPVSLKVASKRSELARVERDIRQTRENIRYLETEFGARASLRQLERWNVENFAYSAPTASQYLDGERQLANLGTIDRDEKQLAVVAPVEAATALVVNDGAGGEVVSDGATAEAQILAAQLKATPAVTSVASSDKPATKVVVAPKPTALNRHAERSRMIDDMMAKDSPVKKPEPKKTADASAVKAKAASKSDDKKVAAKGADVKKPEAKKADAKKAPAKLADASKVTSKKTDSKKSDAKKTETKKATTKKIAQAEGVKGSKKP